MFGAWRNAAGRLLAGRLLVAETYAAGQKRLVSRVSVGGRTFSLRAALQFKEAQDVGRLPLCGLSPSQGRGFGSAAVPAALVKQLRERTGASMGKCREALAEEDGDIERAVDWLRRRGIRSMEKREASSMDPLLALAHSASSGGGAAIVELRAETDFVTKGRLFQNFVLTIAETAAQRAGAGEPSTALADQPLADGPGRPTQLRPNLSVGEAVMELSSVVGERLALGDAWHMPAPPEGGCVFAGYAHPRFADALPGTGRMAALVAVRPSPAVPAGSAHHQRVCEAASKLARHAVAGQPRFLSVDSIPSEVSAKERDTLRAAHLDQMGPEKAKKLDEKVLEKVLHGKMQRFHQEAVFLCQELIAPSASGAPQPLTVEKWLKEESKSLGLDSLELHDFRVAVV